MVVVVGGGVKEPQGHRQLACKLELPAIISELLISTLEQSVYEFKGRKGADDCEYNYAELGFDLHDRYRFISCCLKRCNQAGGRRRSPRNQTGSLQETLFLRAARGRTFYSYRF